MKMAGLRTGSRVAFLGKESVYYYVCFFACAKSGAVLVPINWRLTAEETDHILRDSASELIFVASDLASMVDQISADLPLLKLVIRIEESGTSDTSAAALTQWIAGCPDHDLGVHIDPANPLLQMYTSGTTGPPKGVVLAHRSLFAIRDALAEAGLDWIDWRPGDKSLIGIAGFHIGGIWWASQGFNAGITNIAMPRFDSRGAVDLIRDLSVTTACVVPAMLRLILSEPGVGPDDFRTLRKVVYGGSPIAESLLIEALEVIGSDFVQIYGLTETGNTAVCLPPADHFPGSSRLQAAGRPYPGVRVKIIDEAGGELPSGSVGEVCLHTPARMLEYWGLPEATASILVDGWIHTGDAGYLDADGYVVICDRIKDMIIIAGEKIYPAEIENALTKHPAVAEAAVIGVPDDRFGEAVHAFVVLRPGEQAGPRDFLTFLAGRIASFKIPSRFETVDQLPRNASGKILRRELRDEYWKEMTRHVN
jgi:long-chain acyl-CoA synthetase